MVVIAVERITVPANASKLAEKCFSDREDPFLEYAEKSASKVEVISEETEEGRMLRDSFGKVAAILRYGAN